MTGGVVGTVIAVQEKRPRPRLSILEVVIADGTGPLKIVLFNQGYKKNFYKKRAAFILHMAKRSFNMALCR